MLSSKQCLGIALFVVLVIGTAFAQETDFDPDVVVGAHTAQVSSLDYSGDGTRLLSCSTDGTVRVYNIPTEEVLVNFSLEPAQCTAVAFVPNSNQFLVGDNNATIHLYDNGGNEIRTYTGHFGAITSLAFNADGSQFVSSSEDSEARIWNTDTGESLFTLTGHTGSVWSAGYNSNNSLIVTAGEDDTAIIWNAADGSQVRSLSGHTDDINSVAFSNDGTQVLTGSLDFTAKLWETSTGNEVRTFTGHTDWVFAVAFSPSENKIATSSWDLTTRIWNIDNGQTERILQSNSSAYTANDYKPDGTQLATGNFDGVIWLWDLNTQLEATPTPTHTPTLTPTPTFTPTPTGPTATPTPEGPTPTPRPDGLVLTFRDSIKVYDDANSTTDITGQTDFDTAEGRQLVVEWDADNFNITDWHVYAQVDIYGYFFLGRTGSGDVQRFEWPGSQFVASAQSGGPSFGKTYRFRIFGLLPGNNGFNVVTHSKPVSFLLESSAESPVFTVPEATVPEGTVLVTDDVFDTEDLGGKTDTDSEDQKALFLRWNVGSNDYWNYHVFIGVNGGEPEFAGQTSADDVNYFRWSNIPLFDTKGIYVDGPQSGNTYKFRIFGLKGQGADRVDHVGEVTYEVQ